MIHLTEPAGQASNVVFVEEPEHVLKTYADNSTSVLKWRIHYHGTCNPPGLSINTRRFQLYPDDDPNSPTDEYRDFNISMEQTDVETCLSGVNIIEINFTLSVIFNSRIFTNVPYVVCKVDFSNESPKVCLRAGADGCPSESTTTTEVTFTTTESTEESSTDNGTVTSNTVCAFVSVLPFCTLVLAMLCY